VALTPELDPNFRLSIIVATFGRKGPTEKTIQSLLELEDPIGTEILAVVPEPGDGTGDYLQSIFYEHVAAKRLKIARIEGRGVRDPVRLRNEGVDRSQGTYLAFVEPGDTWSRARLKWLEPLLYRNDLIVATSQPAASDSADWIESFIRGSFSSANSSGIIRRGLYEEVGGFRATLGGGMSMPLPFGNKLPGFDEYELWLRCLSRLRETGKKDRFLLTRDTHVTFEPVLGAAAGAAGQALPPMVPRVLGTLEKIREIAAAVQAAPSLPRRYWLSVARKIVNKARGR
jgi:hypothetical protein